MIALLLAGCDASLELGGASASAERPEGWQSIEAEEASMRLYYQFVDAQRRVRFVERLEDVPEPLRATVGFVKLDVPPPLSPGQAAAVRQSASGTWRTSPGGKRGSYGRPGSCSTRPSGAGPAARPSATWTGVASPTKSATWTSPAGPRSCSAPTGARAVPVIEVDGRVLTGFSSTSYDALLDRA